MGQKPSGAAKAASPRSALMKHHAIKVGKASTHSSYAKKEDSQIAAEWAEARFNVLTNFVHDEVDGASINQFEFDDPLMSAIFGYISKVHMDKTAHESRTHSLNKAQYVEAITNIAKYNNEEMANFITDFLLFMFNKRSNRLHPDTIDANTIHQLVNITPDDYKQALVKDGLTPMAPSEINSFFVSFHEEPIPTSS